MIVVHASACRVATRIDVWRAQEHSEPRSGSLPLLERRPGQTMEVTVFMGASGGLTQTRTADLYRVKVAL